MMSNYVLSLIMFKETELITIPTTLYKKINLNQRTQFSHTHTRGFSALSAPPDNGGIPKANGPVPNRILITYFPIQKKKKKKKKKIFFF